IGDVEEIIEILGTPEEMDDGTPGEEKREYQTGKRVYRDPDNRIIGGVGSGLAAYFGIDPIIMRVILIFTFFISGPLIYLILWVVIPEAKTTAQKLEMRGQKINVENIEKSIKNEFGKVKKGFKNYKKKGYEESRTILDRIAVIIIEIINFNVKVFLIVVGLAFVLASIVILIGLVGGMFIDSWGINEFSFSLLSKVFVTGDNLAVGLIALCIVIGIPVISIMTAGIRLLFGIRTKSRTLNWVSFLFWFFGLIILAFVAFHEIRNYRIVRQETETRIISAPDSTDIVVLRFAEIPQPDNENDLMDFGFIKAMKESDSFRLYGTPSIKINRTDTGSISVCLVREGRGKGLSAAEKNLSMIVYNFTVTDSLIVLDPWFSLPSGQKWMAQELDIEINIPVKYNISGDTQFLRNMDKSFFVYPY
ncbi:MAG: PspC domain-containing protein, partial [Bacteroidota bacterium]